MNDSNQPLRAQRLARYLGKKVILGCCYLLIANGALDGAYLIDFQVTGEKINDQAQLEKVLQEEQGKIRLKDKSIEARFGPAKYHLACARRMSDGRYLILLDGAKTRPALRHELYHIYVGDCDKIYEPTLFRRFIDENRASFYALTGIKL